MDKFGITYEPMEEIMAQGMIWHGLPILELARRTALSIEGDRVS